MATDRTPEELGREDQESARVMYVLQQAVLNLTAWRLAESVNAPPHVCERCVNTIWNDLRENLDGEQRLVAIVLLLTPRADAEAGKVLGLLQHRWSQ